MSQSLNRRHFLRVGGTTLFGLGLADLFRAQATASGKRAAAKQMICIWLAGGPNHRDSFDPKPNAPTEFRGSFKTIRTNVPGIQVSELLPRLAQVADKYTIIRSCTTGDGRADHAKDTNYWLTGNRRQVPQTPKYPTYGSVVAKLKQAPPRVPSFIVLGGGDKDVLTDSYLGAAYAPLMFTQEQAKAMQEMLSIPQINLSAFGRGADLVRAFNAQRRQLDQLDPLLEGRDQFQQKAFDLLQSAKIAQALDLKKENAKTLERYGASPANKLRGGKAFCESVLVARRLIEAGVPFVHINFGGWDAHEDNDGTMREKFPSVDMAVASLLEDLDQSGLLKTTIVALLGEMGRTPWPQGGGGKGSDHWPTQFVVLAGGALRAATSSASRTIGLPRSRTNSTKWIASPAPSTPSWASTRTTSF
ncbi:hypothetical protein HRbin36_01753 [bacterium HR36]|nr:hypothetical protein HRbin36_01753 [bacterium HR36]